MLYAFTTVTTGCYCYGLKALRDGLRIRIMWKLWKKLKHDSSSCGGDKKCEDAESEGAPWDAKVTVKHAVNGSENTVPQEVVSDYEAKTLRLPPEKRMEISLEKTQGQTKQVQMASSCEIRKKILKKMVIINFIKKFIFNIKKYQYKKYLIKSYDWYYKLDLYHYPGKRNNAM